MIDSILAVKKLSPAFRITMYHMKKGHSPSTIAAWQDCTDAERKIIADSCNRAEERRIWEVRQKRNRGMKIAMVEFFKVAKKRKRIPIVRSYKPLMQIFTDYRDNNISTTAAHRIAENDPDTMKNLVRQFNGELASREKRNLQLMLDAKGTPKHLQLNRPLYACSGELEADRMQSYRIMRISQNKGRNRSVTTYWRHSEKLNFETDGGGQAETQFAIEGKLPDVVCGLVEKIGSPRRNGGHIHINCQKHEAIGERVYDALRFHLSWFRWMVPSVRRNHTWCSINGVQNFFINARRTKRAAISANTWNRTGTVEVRLWPTSDKAADWYGRRDMMIAIARWSELHHSKTKQANGTVYPIYQTNQGIAWELFFTWAAVNAPEGLAYALRVLRKKSRSSVASLDRTQSMELYNQFLNSGLTVRGFRSRDRVRA
jgi:hypothetical protein